MLADVAYYIGVVAICIPFVFVFYWMVLGGLKTQVQNTASPPLFLFHPTFENFRKVFVANQFLKYIENSIAVSGGATLLALGLGLPAAHAIARDRPRMSIAAEHLATDAVSIPEAVRKLWPEYTVTCGPCVETDGGRIRPDVLYFR